MSCHRSFKVSRLYCLLSTRTCPMADKILVMHNMSMVRVLMSGYYMAIYSAKVCNLPRKPGGLRGNVVLCGRAIDFFRTVIVNSKMDVITLRSRVDHVCYYSNSLVISVQCDAGLSVFHQSTWITLERNVSVRIVHLPVIIIFKPPPVAVFDVFCIPDFKVTFAYCRPCRRRCTVSARAWDHRQPAVPLSRIRGYEVPHHSCLHLRHSRLLQQCPVSRCCLQSCRRRILCHCATSDMSPRIQSPLSPGYRIHHQYVLR